MKHLRAIACTALFTALPLLTTGCASQGSTDTGLQGWPVFFQLEPMGDPAATHVLRFNPQPYWYMPSSRWVEEAEYDAWLESRRANGEVFAQQDQLSPDGLYPIPVPIPYPASIDDLPINDRGVELYLTIEPQWDRMASGFGDYKFYLTLSTETLVVHRHWMHRYSSELVPPLLFAVYCDGEPLTGDRTGWGMMGGADQMNPIAQPHHPETWHLYLNSMSFNEFIPDDTTEVTIVAVYAERLTEGYFEGDGHQQFRSNFYGDLDRGMVLVRSNAVALHRVDGVWTPTSRGDD